MAKAIATALALSAGDVLALNEKIDGYRERLARVARGINRERGKPLSGARLDELEDEINGIVADLKPRNLGLETIDEQRERYARRKEPEVCRR